MGRGAKPRPLGELFWSKVEVGWTDECWDWNSSLGSTGYGAFTTGRVRGYTSYAHRMAYIPTKGDPGSDMTIDHLCHNKKCCNPAHLEAVPQAENARRAVKDGLRVYVKRTHCKRGHEFTDDNVYRGTNGAPICKKCQKIRDGRRRENALQVSP